jgi:hypothetical protein
MGIKKRRIKMKELLKILNEKNIKEFKETMKAFVKEAIDLGFNYDEVIIVHDAMTKEQLQNTYNGKVFYELGKYWIREYIKELRKAPNENLEYYNGYVLYCKNMNETPSQEGYEKYVETYFSDEA